MSEQAGRDNGPSTNRNNEPVVDPTSNVYELVNSAMRRQDDLRDKDAQHVREMLAIRAEHQAKLQTAESARIDAIRAVDTTAVQQAAQVSAQQATILAAQVATSAETLRTQVAAAAQASTIALAAALEPIIKDVADLRRVQYEQAGQKAQVGEAKVDQRGGTATIIAVAGVLIAILALIASVVLTGP